MSRAKKAAQQRAQDEVSRRRSSASHRSLRRRAARGKGALALDSAATQEPATATPTTADAPVASAPAEDSGTRDKPVVDEQIAAALAQETSVYEPVAYEPVPYDPDDDELVADEPPSTEPSDDERDAGDAGDAADADETAVFDPVEQTAALPPIAPTPPTAPPTAPTPQTPAWLAEPAPPQVQRETAEVHGPDVPDTDVPDADDSDHGAPKRRKGWIIPFVIVGLAVLYVGAQALVSNTVPDSTETMGVDIGGMSATQAQGEVDSHAAQLKAADLELRAAEQVFALPAADAGLDIDAQATVAQVTGFTLAPDRLWAHIAGGSEVDPITIVDQNVLADALETAAAHFDGPAQDAGVTVDNGGVEVVPGRSAVTVDQEGSATLIAQEWPLSQSIELVAQTEPPGVTDTDAQAFALELESQTFAASVTLAGDDAEALIEPATIASHSTVVSGAGGLELEIDGEALTAAILEDNPDLSTDGKDASVSFDDDHDIVIDEGAPGITIDAAQLGDAVMTAAQSADRVGVLPYTAADPEVSAEDLGLADFKEIISTFDTPLTSEWVRTENLRTAAASVQGVILQPGDTFDLTEVLSPINEESGYRASGVIVNGILTQGMGGGLSQMATNAYNAGYFAGYELIEHRPHSVWFTRYPAGRESTMYTGSINVVFRNNTPYAAVLNSYVEGGRLYTEVWSTKHFEVNTSASPRTNVRQPGVKEVTSENCRPKSAGHPGFTITNTRTVLLDGEEVDHNSNTWTYKPDDAIKCVSPDDDEDDEDNDN